MLAINADTAHEATTASPLKAGNYRFLGNLVLALAIVGFPLVAAISQLLGLASSGLNIAYRIVNIALCLVLLGWTASRGTLRFDPLIAAFLTLYSLRLFADLSYSTFPDIVQDSQFFGATVLIPVTALAGGRAWYDEKTCLRFVLGIGGVAGLLIAYSLATNGIVPDSAVNNRATLDFLNPISIGYHGLFLAAAATIAFSQYRSRQKLILCLILILLGGYLMVASGSRGPFIALLGGLLVTGSANRNANATYVLVGSVILGFITYFGAPEVLLDRFRDVGSDSSALERLYASQFSIQEALDHPLLGYAYIEPITGIYPHNLLIESAMAIGLLGFVLMLWMQMSLIWKSWKAAKRGEWWLPFIASAMFVNAWISGSIFGSSLFFVLLWLLRDPRFQIMTRPSHGKLEA